MHIEIISESNSKEEQFVFELIKLHNKYIIDNVKTGKIRDIIEDYIGPPSEFISVICAMTYKTITNALNNKSKNDEILNIIINSTNTYIRNRINEILLDELTTNKNIQ
jgi:hypothetical protein